MLAVGAAPIAAGMARRKRRLVALEDSIQITATQLPEVHRRLVAHCQRLDLDEPELYLSDNVEHTTALGWAGRPCIILSTHDFCTSPEAFDDIVDFALAREVGSICLGHTSYRNDLLTSFVAPLPFLRAPLHQVRTFSRDRYGAYLAPCALRALIVASSGDRLLNRVDTAALLAHIDAMGSPTLWGTLVRLQRKRVPLSAQYRELRRSGLLTR